MFNPTPVFAGVPAGPPRKSSNGPSVSSRIKAMLPGGVRGRGFGRGVPAGPPGAAPAPMPGAPAQPEPSAPAAQVSAPGQGASVGNLPPEFLDYIELMGQNISYLREELSEVRSELSVVNNRGSESQKVFDVLHAELNDYKRDFIFQHIKPMLRPLLFLYDSLEGFDREMMLYENAQRGQDLLPDTLTGTKVRDNLTYLRDQLMEALQVCEVEPLPYPSGTFDARNQKAVDTAPVAPELDGTIVDVIRIGWTMNGHLLRPAEVILGKAKPAGSY